MTTPEPTYSATTERIYASLPEHYRHADGPLGYPLKRYVSVTGDRLAAVETLLDRLDYRIGDEAVPGSTATPTSELVDPDLADVEWLPWLAQLLGVQLGAGLSITERRDAVRFASAGWRAGTKGAVADAARSALIGSRYVEVHDHSTAAGGIGTGGQWDVLIMTRASETPDPAIVLATVARQNAAPAGVKLHHKTYEATWTQVTTAFPTWADWNTRTWAQLQGVGQV